MVGVEFGGDEDNVEDNVEDEDDDEEEGVNDDEVDVEEETETFGTPNGKVEETFGIPNGKDDAKNGGEGVDGGETENIFDVETGTRERELDEMEAAVGIGVPVLERLAVRLAARNRGPN